MVKSTVMQHKSMQSFAFMSLPADIRYIIYKEIFAQRSIILRKDWPYEYGFVRDFERHDIENPDHTQENNIAFLQVCKQVYAEARSVLPRAPNHLVLSWGLYRLPSLSDIMWLDKEGCIPLKHITHLSFNAKTLGEVEHLPRRCLGPPGSRRFDILHPTTDTIPSNFAPHDLDSYSFNHFVLHDELLRLTDLLKIRGLSGWVFDSLPSLRELHIYNVLKTGRSWPPPPCTCSVAGTPSCTCGDCTCRCINHPPLPNEEEISLDDTKSQLYRSFHSRMQAALPHDPFASRTVSYPSDFHTVLGLLGRGVHVFLHDEITLVVPTDVDRGVCKGVWRATYHMIPPKEASTPVDPPVEPVETPGESRLRLEREFADSARAPRRSRAHAADSPAESLELLIEEALFGKRICSEEFPLKLLKDYDAVFDVRIVDESMFDVVINTSKVDSVSSWAERRCGKFWNWN